MVKAYRRRQKALDDLFGGRWQQVALGLYHKTYGSPNLARRAYLFETTIYGKHSIWRWELAVHDGPAVQSGRSPSLHQAAHDADAAAAEMGWDTGG